MNDKADLDAADEGGEPFLDANYPPWGEPLYWEEFKEGQPSTSLSTAWP